MMSSASAGACISSAATSIAFPRSFTAPLWVADAVMTGARADPVSDRIGLAMGHAHAPVIDAQSLGANLRHHGLEALPEGSAAGDELHRARTIDLDAHAIGGTQPAFLHQHPKSRAHRFPPRPPAPQPGPATCPFRPRPSPVGAARTTARNDRS